MSCKPRSSLLLYTVLLGLFLPLPESARPAAMRPVKIAIAALFLLLIFISVELK